MAFIFSDINCTEPQAVALVSLAVDITLSLYLHGRTEGENGEPAPKRRRLLKTPSSESERLECQLDKILKRLFEDFDRTLSDTNDLTPNARLIFRFLREVAIKTPNHSILHGLPDGIVRF